MFAFPAMSRTLAVLVENGWNLKPRRRLAHVLAATRRDK
jgi:hypothetical protein